ncbi:RidA family protein [Bradyrhizobium diazoefficiens]|nr:RidA family protein [Bradyrhizobium diazoefficiens]MBR0774703.1 RidA family protein [Bradyrhizobium diazoefficiens]MBR0849105.1 RidA family protein [Bradyrhizobium diazoefficiens]
MADAEHDNTGGKAVEPIFHLLADAPRPVAPYSHAVEAGPFVFVTGQLATDPDDDALPVPPGIAAQTRKVMDNLARVLRGCGMTFANVVFVRIYLTDFKRDYAPMNAIFSTYFDENRRPGRTTVGVTDLARGGIIEIDLIAARA